MLAAHADVLNAARTPLKRAWTADEDAILIDKVSRDGAHSWANIARVFHGTRKDKQCRERWFNHLCPDVNKGEWTPEEDEAILKGVAEFGTVCAATAFASSARQEGP